MINCTTLYGKNILIPRNKLIFRPGAYALILNGGEILMVNNRSTGKYFFPGGGVNLGEKIEEAIRREVWEEVGIEIEIGKLLYFKESFFITILWMKRIIVFRIFLFANRKPLLSKARIK